jgi:signal transduction histidine kinase
LPTPRGVCAAQECELDSGEVKVDSSHLVDAAVPLLVGAIVVAAVALQADAARRPLALALGVGAAAVLVLRRRAPWVTLVASGGLVLGVFAVDHTAGALAATAPAAALYSLALTRSRTHLLVAVIAAAAAVAIADTVLVGRGIHTFTLQTAGHVALVAVPVLAAEALRNRRSYVRLLLERLEQAEASREEEAERRAEQERLRIARDLHDVVAHTLTTINVQAGVAKHLLGRDAIQNAEDALATIEAASHEALDELRSILGVLREPSGSEAPLEPAPSLADVDALIDQARLDGLEVDVDVEGERPARIPDAVQLAAFRILQESLTNARRHAPGAPARVNFGYDEDRLRVAVENDAITLAGRNGNAGVGIVGMRERARALGGTLEARQDGSHFRVVAELPYRRGS